MLTPQTSEALESDTHLRLLLMGPPKVGKTSVIASTAPKPVYFINADMGDSLRPALDHDKTFLHNTVKSMRDMEDAIKVARDLVGSGKVNTVALDTLTSLSEFVAEECLKNSENDKGEPDGRKAWPAYHKYLQTVIGRLFNLKAHVIVVAHYMNLYGDGDPKNPSKVAKVWKPGGEGIVPLLYGASRQAVPKAFNDVVFMEKANGKRVFVCDDDGVYGIGCRNLKGVDVVDADIEKLFAMFGKAPAVGG